MKKQEKKGTRAFVLRSSGSGGCSRGYDAKKERALETEDHVAKEEKRGSTLLVEDKTTWAPLPLLILYIILKIHFWKP